MGRQLRSRIPVIHESLLPKQIPFERIVETDKYLRHQQKSDYDRRHRAREKPKLRVGDTVFIPDRGEYGKVVAEADTPRSLVVSTNTGTLRRNRRKLVSVTMAPDRSDDSLSIEDYPDVINETDYPVPDPVDDGGPEPEEEPAAPDQGAQAHNQVVTRSGRVVKPREVLDM